MMNQREKANQRKEVVLKKTERKVNVTNQKNIQEKTNQREDKLIAVQIIVAAAVIVVMTHQIDIITDLKEIYIIKLYSTTAHQRKYSSFLKEKIHAI